MKNQSRYFLLAILTAGWLYTAFAGEVEEEITVDTSKQYTMATYRVAVEKQEEFLALLKGAELEMREVGLITSRPVIRMRSLADRQLLLEIFEWVDSEAFGRAQRDPRILAWWQKYEATWLEGGFGLDQFPESSQAWAQFEPID